MIEPNAGPDRQHVVMVVGNDVSSDTRVKKSAISLVRAGLRVTVVGYVRGTQRQVSTMSDVQIVRTPIRWVLRDDPTDGRWHRIGLKLRLRRTDLDVWRARHFRGDGRVGRAATTAGYLAARAVLSMNSRVVTAGRRIEDGRNERRQARMFIGDGGLRAWRRTVPVVLDLEAAMLEEIVRLKPDVIHAHDVSVVSVAAKAAALASIRGAAVPWVYDAHEYVAGISLYKSRSELERAGWLALEREFVPTASRIVTVSPRLAELLAADYPSEHPPAVVINAPWPGQHHPSGGLRAAIGIDRDVPLMVYSGGLTEARGVVTAVEALPLLPNTHLAVVPVPAGSPYVVTLRARAEELGVDDRVHFTPPVEPADVVANLSTADVGLIPILRFPSHDVALTNKLFEYLHAGLPVVVSDCPAQRAFVAEQGVGESFIAGDPADFARAASRVLSDLDRYRERIQKEGLLEKWSWREAEHQLVAAYRSLLGDTVQEPDPVENFPSLEESVDEAGDL